MWCVKDNWAEKLEDSLLDLPQRQLFVKDEDACLSKRLLRFPNHVAGALLSDHDLDWNQFGRVLIMNLSLKCDKLETRI